MSSTLVSEMFLRMSETTPSPVEWVWEGLVPRRNLTLLTGDPGIGKSLVTLQVAAVVTRGVTNPRDLTPANWLKDELALEAAPSELVQRRASQVHLSYGTLRRAFKLIGGKVRKQKNQWFWSLPEDEVDKESSVAAGNLLVI